METVSGLLLILVLDTLCVITGGRAAPLSDTKDTWNRNVFAPVMRPACSSDGRCWKWLPISESHDETPIISERNSDVSRVQFRRQIANPTSEFMRSWKDGTLDEAGHELRSPLPSNKQISSRIAKKDMFASRSWGAGGMPFSVLYMNPHGPRTNHAVTAMTMSQRQESGTTTESPMPFIEHLNSRITPRNGQPTVQPRRQYWTIPHLFISYGWGPFGK